MRPVAKVRVRERANRRRRIDQADDLAREAVDRHLGLPRPTRRQGLIDHVVASEGRPHGRAVAEVAARAGDGRHVLGPVPGRGAIAEEIIAKSPKRSWIGIPRGSLRQR